MTQVDSPVGNHQNNAYSSSTSSKKKTLTCSERFHNFCKKHEKSLTITGLVLVIMLAVVGLGLIIASGTIPSPVLLAVGVVVLLLSFVIMSTAAIKLAVTKINPSSIEAPHIVLQNVKVPLGGLGGSSNKRSH